MTNTFDTLTIDRDIDSDFDAFNKGFVQAILWANAYKESDIEDEGLVPDYDADYAYHTPGRWWEGIGIDADSADTGIRAFFDAHYVSMILASEISDRDFDDHGHDFALTRNGHGTGFWDRGYPAALGDYLTAASEVYGEFSVLTDDGDKIWNV